MAAQADADDYWAQAVSLYTGYSMPSRKALFDKLKSKDGIPLMRVHLVEHKNRSVNKDDFSAVSGWHASHGEDYRLAFYTHHGSDDVRLFTADITFIRPIMGDDGMSHLLDGGATRDGGTAKGKDGEEWDDNDLWRYVSAPKSVFNALVQDHKTTHFSFGGVSVADADAVDLHSFDRAAESFDRTARFFKDQMKILAKWNEDLGGDKAAWKGESADVMRSLINTLHTNYENYVDQMGGADYSSGHVMLGSHVPSSIYADMLFQAQWDLHFEAKVMESAWANWANSGEHDPYRALLEELDELSRWIIQNNVPYVLVTEPDYTNNVYQDGADNDEDLSVHNYDATFGTAPGFTDNPGFGALDDINAWKVIGERAVTRWNNNVDGYLVEAARQSLSRLGAGWNTVSESLGVEVTTKSQTSLSQDYEKKETNSKKEAAEKSLNDANKKNQEAWQSLNDNLSDSNKNNKSLFDNLNNNLADSNNNQKQLNSSLSGLGDSFTKSLNSGAGLKLDGGGSGVTSPLSTGLGDVIKDTSNLGTGTTLPLNNPASLIANAGTGNYSTGHTSPLNLNPGFGTALPLNNPASLIANASTGNYSTGHTSPLNLNPGSLTTDNPRLDGDGNLVQTHPDGTTTVYNPDTGQLVTTDPNGHTTTTQLNPGDPVTIPDGGHVQLNPDGTLTTQNPDGTTTVFNPSNGTLQTTNPDGTHTTTTLNKPIDVPHVSSGGTNLSHGGTSPLNNGLSGGGNEYLDSDTGPDYLDYDSTPFTGGTLGGNTGGYTTSGTNTSTAPPGGTPLNPGFGAGAGGAGAGGANGERVRTVLNDSNNLSALRRNGSVASAVDGETMPFRQSGAQTTSSPMGGAPMGGMQGGQSTESGERQRTNWVDEEEDVWGTEEGGTPAVIG
ncbi:AAWKG family protein [Streptomyces sp. NPDC001292]|uniref:AAWKG family protein n=1 Tax=Streptomyces sp. NPDC001292 TaxID=3364558 RepID=UPI0036CE2FC2